MQKANPLMSCDWQLLQFALFCAIYLSILFAIAAPKKTLSQDSCII